MSKNVRYSNIVRKLSWRRSPYVCVRAATQFQRAENSVCCCNSVFKQCLITTTAVTTVKTNTGFFQLGCFDCENTQNIFNKINHLRALMIFATTKNTLQLLKSVTMTGCLNWLNIKILHKLTWNETECVNGELNTKREIRWCCLCEI